MPSVLVALTLVVGICTAVPSGAAVGGATVPTSIASDCSRDVTAELSGWFASVPDNSTLTFAPDGCYRVDGTLPIVNRAGLTFEGNNSTFRAVTDGTELVNPTRIRSRSMWNFVHSTDLVVRNVIVIGANPYAGIGERAYQPKFEAQHAYLTEGVKRMLMDHVAAYDVYGDFVWVGPGTEDLTVRNSTFARNGRQGWTINGKNIVFESNSITDTRRATIDMEPSQRGWASQNIYIRDNDIGPGRLFFFASVGAAAPMDNINIIGNRFHHKSMVIYVAPPKGTRSNYRVIGNVSDAGVSGSGSAMVFKNVVGLEVRNNRQRVQPSHWLAGVAVRGSTNVAISDNVFRGAKASIIDRGGNTDIAQWNNLIGIPPRVEVTTRAAGPTPTPAARVHTPAP
jgi:hypothetical protein